MNITTTVTWDALQRTHDDELDRLKDAHDEVTDVLEQRYDRDELRRPVPDDPELVDDDMMDWFMLRMQAKRYSEAAEHIQKRQNILSVLESELGGGAFEVKMLSGDETLAIESELQMLAKQQDVSVDDVQHRRNALTVDAATVDAPEGIPRDDEESPVPSEGPSALVLSLWEHVERFNNAGDTDFRAEGFGSTAPEPSVPAGSSATPTGSGASSQPSQRTDETPTPDGS